ncbi:MAG TPA: uracil-DNA glycosylase [Thermoplasmataceae archaeon]|nr:uracil-DNA glycosylase [Thermoplasmatales archaeon AK]HLH85361.1 uracil-DNA glycosylase [Thermoplasmataceae archaeon]
MGELEDLCTEISYCKNCDLYFSRKTPVCGFGSRNPSIMIIGEAPGAKEDELGKPFVGRSGMLLNKALDQSGIERKTIYLTNSVRCRPKIGRGPKVNEIKKCSQYLRREVQYLAPPVIVPMGNSALKSLGIVLGRNFGRISELEGEMIFSDGIIIAPQYHPAAILRNPKRMERFKDNFRKLASFMKEREINGPEALKNHKIKIF